MTRADGDRGSTSTSRCTQTPGAAKGARSPPPTSTTWPSGDHLPVDVAPPAVEASEAIVVYLVDRLRRRDFTASPAKRTCQHCDVRRICPEAV